MPTTARDAGIDDPVSKLQVDTLDANCAAHGIVEFTMTDRRQGIVHVIGPEQGATLPGMTVVCGDSHTSTHGAFAALSIGIGTSEVEHVMATQCLLQKRSRNMLISVDGQVGPGVTAKDIVLAIIARIGTAAGTGYAIEFGGDAIRALSMEGRMTVCNMAIEAGARVGMVAVDDTTINYLQARRLRRLTNSGMRPSLPGVICTAIQMLFFDEVVHIERRSYRTASHPGVTSPEMVTGISGAVPDPDAATGNKAEGMQRALAYMDLQPQTAITVITLTVCLSVPAPIPASRICVQLRQSSRTVRWRPASSRRWSCPAPG